MITTFITHQIPKGLLVDELLSFGSNQQVTPMELADEEAGLGE